MKAVIFSGTGDGRLLSYRLADMGCEVTVSVATEVGLEEQGEHANICVRCGRLDKDEMRELIINSDICIDATHPYAFEATKNIRAAAQEAGVEYCRLLRSGSDIPELAAVFPDTDAAIEYLSGQDGNILLATGSKELDKFAVLGAERLYPRVLPTFDALTKCEQAHIPHRNIIAVQGPFTVNLNAAMLEQYNISYLVTRDGGRTGGFEEKAEAAVCRGVKLIVIGRREEQGMDFEAIVQYCSEKILLSE